MPLKKLTFTPSYLYAFFFENLFNFILIKTNIYNMILCYLESFLKQATTIARIRQKEKQHLQNGIPYISFRRNLLEDNEGKNFVCYEIKEKMK